MRHRFPIVLSLSLIASTAVLLAWCSLGADPAPKGHLPSQVIIKFKSDSSPSERAAIRRELKGRTLKKFSRIGAELMSLEGIEVERAVKRYRKRREVEYIEPDYWVKALEIPDDPLFDQLWGMRNTGQWGGTPDADIDADGAWEIGTGTREIVVGVIDTGVDYDHPDLAANMWTNPAEVPGNGIDDDGNGFVDDYRGWDFYNRDNNPMDDNGHGTHCAGTVGAVGNNGVGVAGVCWSVSILPIKFLNRSGDGSLSDAISAIEYAASMGVNIMSNSWGGGGYSRAMIEAIEDARDAGALFVAAAGNSSADNDLWPHFPSSYEVENVIAVAATDNDDRLAYFSSYGPTSVDLAAPGTGIVSTLPGGTYGDKSGTSMATPHVSGAAALLWSLHPGMQADLVKERLLATVDRLPSLENRCVTEGRLNVLYAVAQVDSVAPGAVADLETLDPGSNTMGLAWTATGDDDAAGTASYYEVRYSASPITEDNFHDAVRVGGEPNPLPSGSYEQMEVAGLECLTTYYFALKAHDEFGTEGPISNVATGATLGPPRIAVTPAALAESLRTGEPSGMTLTLSNQAEGTLDFTVAGIRYAFTSSAPTEYVELLKGEEDPRSGPPVADGHGGPDGYGYVWIDSREPGGPTFDWVDISQVGTPILHFGDDVNAGPFYIGFDFQLYGNEFDSFNVSSNGFISFTSTASPFVNQRLPNSQAPENMIAPFWDDLMVGDGRVFMHNDGTRLIIQYDSVDRYGYGGPYTFEIILYPSGKIVFQYLSMTNPRDSATIGIQDAFGEEGLQVAFNQAYVRNRLAVVLKTVPEWMSLSPSSGRIISGSSLGLDVAFDPTGLTGGDYEAEIVIESNDPIQNTLLVPVSLNVTGAPRIVVGGKTAFVTSTQEYATYRASTHHELKSSVPVGGPGLLSVEVAGDFGQPEEVASVTLEGTVLGKIGSIGWDCGAIRRDFELSAGELEGLLADGVVEVVVSNSFYVGFGCGDDRHTVILSYPGPGHSLDFGGLFVGLTNTLDITVQNVGTDVLSVTSISTDADGFSVSPLSMSLTPGAAGAISVVFSPPSPGEFSGTLLLESNDPEEPLVGVLLTGEALEPPVMRVSPEGIDLALIPGMSGERILAVLNDGASDLKIGLFARRTASEAVASQALTPPSQALTPASQASAPAGLALEDTVSSLKPPPGYAPGSEGLALEASIAAEFADVLIVQDLKPWGSSATQALLEHKGLSYDQITTFELASWDITPYRVVILSSDQFSASYLNVANQRSKLESYLDLGGVLEVHGCGVGWNFGDPRYLVLPDGVRIDINESSYNFITKDHPLVAGVPSPFYGNAASHCYFVGLPAGAEVIARDDEGEPSLVVYQHGRGLVIASTQTLEFGYDHNESAGQILRNMVAYSTSIAGVGWMALSTRAGTVEPGDSLLVTMSFDTEGLEEGDYEAQIVLGSNDPVRSHAVVPVNMAVRTVDAAYVDLEPGTLNLGAKAKYVTCYIELPEEYEARDIVVDSVHPLMDASVTPEKHALGDHDHNGVDDLMVKFSRPEFAALLVEGDSVGVTVAGEIRGTAWFIGTDFVRVIRPHAIATSPAAGTSLPQRFALFQNRPNPANGETGIEFDLPVRAKVSLKIFDASGALVKDLVDRWMPPGRHSILWNGSDNRGRRVSSGVYFFRLDAADFTSARKLILVQD